MSELSDKIEIYCTDKIDSLEDDMRKITIWCSDSADCSYKIEEYKNIIQWLHNKKGCVDVSDVNNFLSLNIDAFDKELENSVLLKTRYRLGFRKDIYVDLNSWLWRNYYKEMHDIYYWLIMLTKEEILKLAYAKYPTDDRMQTAFIEGDYARVEYW